MSGCGDKSLQHYFSDAKRMQQIQDNLDEIQESRSQYFTSITFEVKGNDVYYRYAIAKGVEVDKEGLDELSASLEEQAKKFRKSCIAEYDTKPRYIYFLFTDGKGKSIATYKF